MCCRWVVMEFSSSREVWISWMPSCIFFIESKVSCNWERVCSVARFCCSVATEI